MYCLGIVPPTIALTNSKPSPRAVGAHPQVGDGELPVAAGLLLDLALGLGRADDRLAVGHADVLGVDVDAELARQPLERDGQVGVAAAAQHGLVGLLVALDDAGPGPRPAAAAGRPSLSSSACVTGISASAEHRRGRASGGGTRTGASFGAERVAGRACGQLGDRGDVAGDDPVAVQVLLAAQEEQAVQALLGAGRRC